MTGTGGHAHKHQDGRNVEEVTDGPQPMRNMKACKTNPNSVDKFWQSHQAEYEARGKRNADDLVQVHDHNATYPVLRDELDRRRSISKVTAITARKEVDDACSSCLKIDLLNTKKYKQRYQRKRNSRNKEKEFKSSRCRRSNFKNKFSRRFINRSCQCRIPAVFKDTVKTSKLKALVSETGVIRKKVKTDGKNPLNNLRKTTAARQITSVKENEYGSEDGSLKNPSSIEPSVSSYSSFLSLDNEPMVS